MSVACYGRLGPGASGHRRGGWWKPLGALGGYGDCDGADGAEEGAEKGGAAPERWSQVTISSSTSSKEVPVYCGGS